MSNPEYDYLFKVRWLLGDSEAIAHPIFHVGELC